MFGLNLNEDIICITTDGAVVMQKVGKLLVCKQQLCFAHAIHLAVSDILYKKQNIVAQAFVNDASDCETDSDDDQDGSFHLDLKEDEPELSESFDVLIRKVRTVVKMFRRSPTKNDDILQKYTKEEFGKEMQLLIDLKTRWNSLYIMLERFRKLKNSIRKSLIDLNCIISFEEEEWNMINVLVTTLEPIQLAAEALCRKDATLLTADTTNLFMINNLRTQGSAFSLQMVNSDQLNQVISKDADSTITRSTKNTTNIATIIKQEMYIFEMEGSRGKNLEACYRHLLTIPPTSVEPVRVFSSSEKFCNKIRSALNDESLDILCFLKSHFSSETTK